MRRQVINHLIRVVENIYVSIGRLIDKKILVDFYEPRVYRYGHTERGTQRECYSEGGTQREVHRERKLIFRTRHTERGRECTKKLTQCISKAGS